VALLTLAAFIRRDHTCLAGCEVCVHIVIWRLTCLASPPLFAGPKACGSLAGASITPYARASNFCTSKAFACGFLIIGSSGVVCFGRSVDQVTHVLLHKWHTARLTSIIDKKCHTLFMYLPIFVSDSFLSTVNNMIFCTPVWALTSTCRSTLSVVQSELWQCTLHTRNFLALPSICRMLHNPRPASTHQTTSMPQTAPAFGPGASDGALDGLTAPTGAEPAGSAPLHGAGVPGHVQASRFLQNLSVRLVFKAACFLHSSRHPVPASTQARAALQPGPLRSTSHELYFSMVAEERGGMPVTPAGTQKDFDASEVFFWTQPGTHVPTSGHGLKVFPTFRDIHAARPIQCNVTT
jgi:hypothetical protein